MKPENACQDCPKDQPEHLCESCGACLYKTAKQIPDEMYPLFECRECGKVNFWD